MIVTYLRICENKMTFCRMPFQTFNKLLEMIIPIIEKQEKQLGKVISARKRLAINLHYLATGMNTYFQWLSNV